MRVELREFKEDTLVLLFPEDETESKALDLLGLPDEHVYGQLRLADGFREYYMAFKVSENPVTSIEVIKEKKDEPRVDETDAGLPL